MQPNREHAPLSEEAYRGYEPPSATQRSERIIMNIQQKDRFKYVEEGAGPTVVLLHGLFGELSNWRSVIEHLRPRYRVIVPILPIYELSVQKASMEGLRVFLEDFTTFMELDNAALIGNSLGGHLGIVYALNHPEKVNKLVLTGSSGLFEDTTGGTYPQRGNYEFIRERVAHTFYDPDIASKELVDTVFEIVKDRLKCIKIIRIARSAQKHNVAAELHRLQAPTLLIWGLNDTITPPMVAHEFNRLIRRSQLRFIDRCCHVPMMERPQKFNTWVDAFLTEKI